jgi:ATP-dependent RNA helicase RhlE
MTFRDLGLCDPILKALDQEGYVNPTPIQQGAIPPALQGRDVLGCAQTGTGKTCAFSAPILQRLDGRHPRPRVIRALILTPTRELAIQIQESMASYGRNLRLKSAVIFGGVGQQPQVDAIRKGLDILVATPGRLLDLHGQGLLDLSHIEIFVLDEADRMLDMGFIHDVRRVLKLLPEQKQTLFFSATMPPEVMGLVNDLLHDYARVEVDPVSSPVEVIQQSLYYVDKNNKTKLLAHLVEKLDIPSALVFSRTKHGANRIAQDLNKAGITAAAIHGNKSQTARVQALNDFKSGKIRVLVATDIAARGIDIEELAYVFNYNLPDVPETYVHRIGRTGRAGHDGVAISFCQFDEKDELKAIQKLLGRAIPVVEDHPFPMTNFAPPVKDKHGRPVNAEDAEARAAARERRRLRDAENKARAEAKKQEAEQLTLSPAPETAPETEAPARKRRRRKKSTEAPVEAASAQAAQPEKEKPIAPRERSAGARGVRQGRLEDTLPADPSMPVTEFYKPNPLDSDVIMDATARLLAPRRTAAQSHSHRPRQSEGKGQPKPVRAKAEQTDSQRAQEHKRGQHQKKQTPAKTAQPSHAGDKPAPAHDKKKRRRRNDRPRPIERSLYARQKDSTEQESLMRPYYVNHDD